jgi:LPXTG-motif cell wall-anchored protein
MKLPKTGDRKSEAGTVYTGIAGLSGTLLLSHRKAPV